MTRGVKLSTTTSAHSRISLRVTSRPSGLVMSMLTLSLLGLNWAKKPLRLMPGLPSDERRTDAQRVRVLAGFDLDHRRAIVAEVTRGDRTSRRPGKVHDLQPGEDVARRARLERRAGVALRRRRRDRASSPPRMAWLCSPSNGARRKSSIGVAEKRANGPAYRTGLSSSGCATGTSSPRAWICRLSTMSLAVAAGASRKRSWTAFSYSSSSVRVSRNRSISRRDLVVLGLA